MNAANRCHACRRTEIMVTERGEFATMTLTVDELLQFARCATDVNLRERLLTVAALLDFDKADEARMEIERTSS